MRTERRNKTFGRIPPPQGHGLEEAQCRNRAIDGSGVGGALVLVDLEGAQVPGAWKYRGAA